MRAPNTENRATKKTAAKGGASVPSAKASTTISNQVKKNAAGMLAIDEHVSVSQASQELGFTTPGLSLNQIGGPVVFNDNPNAVQAPYVTPGVRATRDQNTYLNSDITAVLQPGNALTRKTNWGFRFHYNPETISESVTTNYTLVPDTGDVGNVLGTGLGAISFKFLVNRMEDVASRRPFSQPVGTVLGKKNFYDLGTLYDIEFLYRTINGDPQSTGILKHGPTAADPNGTANLGFLYMTAVQIRFNNLKFKGFITSLDFEHIMFSDKMVPTLTYVTVAATRYLSGSPIPATDEAPPKKQDKAKPKRKVTKADKNTALVVGAGGTPAAPGI